MNLTTNKTYDVVVVGAGLAGLQSAWHAARNNASTALICNSHIYAGSSFFPGTWGLGLIGPENEQDTQNLIDSIIEIGQHVTNNELVTTFVENINPCIEKLQQEGLQLVEAHDKTQREFIPCFDTKLRSWHGITHKETKEFFDKQFKRYPVELKEQHDLIKIVTKKDHGKKQVTGAVFFNKQTKEFELISCKSLVLATGGFSGLFQRHLTASSTTSSVQGIALQAGCNLVNLEFMQIMPGMVYPKKGIVFNEKVFRYTQFTTEEGNDAIEEIALQRGITQSCESILESRSLHGPFTCKDNSYLVDSAIDKAGEQGLLARCTLDKNKLPEFVQTYDTWLFEKTGIHIQDDMRIALYAHAANGGIAINSSAQTNIEGLYACGEVTGGMHGADRIGGLSSANGLVFGEIAGNHAAAYAKHCNALPSLTSYTLESTEYKHLNESFKKLQALLSRCGMVSRNETDLQAAIHTIQKLRQAACTADETTLAPQALAQSLIFAAQLTTAEAFLSATLNRRESRGSHNRTDFPQTNNVLARPQYLKLSEDGTVVSSLI